MAEFLPVDKNDLKRRGLLQLDIIIISGDAYVDHPSFGPVLIARYLETHGFTVGIIPQPNWQNDLDFLKLGAPKLFWGVSAGNLDSLVANYTADKKIRRTDMYSPGNEAGHRPDRATILYTNRLKKLFPRVPVVLGGVEASLRRFAHYDYWDDKVRRSLIFDAKADYLVYGMGEKGILAIAKALATNSPPASTRSNPPPLLLREEERGGELKHYPNAAIIVKDISRFKDALLLPSYEEVSADKKKYAEAFKLYYLEGRKKNPRIIIQPCQGRYLVVFPPENLNADELDSLFTLPFVRAPHPIYKGKEIPAWGFVKFSTVSHRGCFGGCSFCAISQHQGKYITNRKLPAIKKEIESVLIKQPGFTGNILDVGGPTANMYGMECTKAEGCTQASCIYPTICRHLKSSQKPALELLQQIRKIPGVKKLFIGSGIRYDLALLDDEYLEELVKHHVSGQLSIAPEHICEEVLLMMGKPKVNRFLEFKEKFEKLSQKHGKKQFIIPYFIAAHPGSTLQHALELALFLKKQRIKVEQVQNFTPTPMTVATCMYYTGLDPFSGKLVHVPRGEERSLQKALLQPTLEKNYRQVVKALKQLQHLNLLKVLTGPN